MTDHDGQLPRLPPPTAAQTARFADHVAANHSWYKHLPFFPPGAAFVLFPNPHAGRGVRSLPDERYAVYDLERGDYFAHHSRLSTADYRAAFGYWDYWVDHNPRVAHHEPGSWVFSPAGTTRALLPDELKREWACRVTAFVKPAPLLLRLLADDPGREVEAFRAYAAAHPADPTVARYLAALPDLLAVNAERLSWGRAVDDFCKAEAQAQRDQLLRTLRRVRAAWPG